MKTKHVPYALLAKTLPIGVRHYDALYELGSLIPAGTKKSGRSRQWFADISEALVNVAADSKALDLVVTGPLWTVPANATERILNMVMDRVVDDGPESVSAKSVAMAVILEQRIAGR